MRIQCKIDGSSPDGGLGATPNINRNRSICETQFSNSLSLLCDNGGSDERPSLVATGYPSTVCIHYNRRCPAAHERRWNLSPVSGRPWESFESCRDSKNEFQSRLLGSPLLLSLAAERLGS